MLPSVVNFKALLSKFSKIYLSLFISVIKIDGNYD